jgi:glycine/D-amino acid oxidase-like deaminating enzyme
MKCDLLIIGAGYYGVKMALHFAAEYDLSVVLVEREKAIMRRASYTNQARVHGGYHYPRALDTAHGSRHHFISFIEENHDAIEWSYESIYGIARNSKVSSRQFVKVCNEIGAPIHSAPIAIERLVDHSMIDAIYSVEEYVFNSEVIAAKLSRELDRSNVELRLGSEATIDSYTEDSVHVNLNGSNVEATAVINATYAGIDACGVPIDYPLRKELAEIAIIMPAPALANYGITIMDGPFFSTLPFPALDAFSLTHVRFTPVSAWHSEDEALRINYRSGIQPPINAQSMLSDAARFIPAMARSRILGSIYDIKTVVLKREGDDGRPTAVLVSGSSPRIISVLGSKIDTVQDALDAVEKIFSEEKYFG